MGIPCCIYIVLIGFIISITVYYSCKTNKSNQVNKVYVLGTCRHGVLIKEDGTQIMTKPHVTNYYSNTVSAIDTSTNKVVTTINFEIGPCAGP
jgi:YVTN family beta-propeller protein